MKVLITNITTMRNKGCEALVKVILRQISSRMNAEFTLFSNDVEYDKLHLSGVCLVPTPPYASKAGKQWLQKTFKRGYWSEKTAEIVNSADLVISSGGDVFSSEYSGLGKHLLPIRRAVNAGKKVALLAHSIGPFKEETERQEFMKGMAGIPLLTLREAASTKYVKEMDLAKTHVEHTADPAFLLEPADPERVDGLFDFYGIPKNKKVIAVSLSQGIASFSKTSQEKHAAAIEEWIGYVIREMGMHVVLIPHVHERNVKNDDRILCSNVSRSLGFPKDLTNVSGDHSTEELKGIIGKCGLVFAERMHAAIAGLSQAVPTVVIGYSIKGRGILEDLYGDDYSNHLIPIKEVTAASLVAKTKDAVARGEETCQRLQSVLPAIKKRAHRNFDLLKP